jgi:two-component system sensor histidine kinase RegB
MINNQQNLFYQPVRDEWVRLRTFIYLRWLAVFGQSGAVIAGFFFLNLSLRLDLIFSLVLLSVSINIMATLLYPENKRLTEKDIMLLLMYDLIQLGILLFLTGGLTNPFSVLVLAPVVISATALRLGPTLILGFIATTLITILGFFYLHLKI